jgi:hypothetical protein
MNFKGFDFETRIEKKKAQKNIDQEKVLVMVCGT